MYGPKVITKLLQKKYRQEYGCFIVEGKKGVLDALKAQSLTSPDQHLKTEVIQLILNKRFLDEQPEFSEDPLIQDFLRQQDVLELDEYTFNRLMDSATPQGIAAIVKIPTLTLQQTLQPPAKLIAVLEDIRDPGNLGTMIRTADWFGADAILLIGGADPYQPKVVRSSMGSLFHMPLILSQNLHTDLATIKEYDFQIVVTRPELAGETANTTPFPDKIAVVFGNEADGTSGAVDALADRAMSIPKFGDAESLNVAVSFGIVMNELRK